MKDLLALTVMLLKFQCFWDVITSLGEQCLKHLLTLCSCITFQNPSVFRLYISRQKAFRGQISLETPVGNLSKYTKRK